MQQCALKVGSYCHVPPSSNSLLSTLMRPEVFSCPLENQKNQNKFVWLFFGRIYGMPICLQFNLTFTTIFYLSLECLNETQTSESFTSAFSCPLENQTNKNKFVCLFFGRIYSTPICLQFNLTFTTIFYLSFDCLNETQTQVKALRAPSPALFKPVHYSQLSCG